jgi:hypothetical protein
VFAMRRFRIVRLGWHPHARMNCAHRDTVFLGCQQRGLSVGNTCAGKVSGPFCLNPGAVGSPARRFRSRRDADLAPHRDQQDVMRPDRIAAVCRHGSISI